MQWFVGGVWESLKTLRVTTDSSWTEFARPATSVAVLRNSPEFCAVRIFFGKVVTSDVYHLDIGLRSGARHAEFLWNSPTQVTDDYGVKLMTATPMTTHTSGAHATSADADGNKVILSTPQTVSVDVTNGRIRGTTAPFPFMVGLEPGSPTTNDTFTNIVYQYFAEVGETQRVVQS